MLLGQVDYLILLMKKNSPLIFHLILFYFFWYSAKLVHNLWLTFFLQYLFLVVHGKKCVADTKKHIAVSSKLRRKRSVCVMRGMMHARMRINPHGWTQEVTQLRITLSHICLARRGSHACFQNTRFKKILIFILILILSEKMMGK